MKPFTWRDLLTAGYQPPVEHANDDAKDEIGRDLERLERLIAAFRAARRIG